MTDNEKAIRHALESGPTPGPWINAKPLYGSKQLDDDELQEWYASDSTIYQIANPDDDGKIAVMYDYEKGGIVRAVDAAYIAAVNPAAITALLAELDALRADAKRYSWLRKKAYATEVDCDSGAMQWQTPYAALSVNEASLDAFIDAAIAQQEGAK